MTRRVYDLVAKGLRATRTCWAEHPSEDYPDVPDPRDPEAGSICPEQQQFLATVNGLADRFANDNPRFDRDLFLKRAGALQ